MSKQEKELIVTKNVDENGHNIYDAVVPKLATGLLNIYEKPLKNVKDQLEEVENTQEKLLEKIHKKNRLIEESRTSIETQTFFNKMKLYHSKLQGIKRNMRYLHEKSVKLKARALKLQEIKTKQENDEIVINPHPSTSFSVASTDNNNNM